ncbi:hypothetical protein BDR26DRAFT_262935 [Obelidium mucronatum]|nr:hypothetical protein BDR26DRAFT_262935 [Obelidium mucronatum]
MDGKVMGHLLCRVIGCNLDIIGINTKFCINHAGSKGKCIISGCANQKQGRENSFDYQPLSCKEAEHMEAVRKFFSEPSTTSEKAAKKYGGKTRVSVGHVKDDERNYEEFGFCYSPFDRFLPGVFLVVWSCGHIMDIGKMYLFESNKFITGFLCQTFMRLDEYPTFMFYDKACVFVRTLKNGAQQNKLLHKMLYQKIIWVVDRFHFRNHSRQDRFCMENCDAGLLLGYTKETSLYSTHQQQNSVLDGLKKWDTFCNIWTLFRQTFFVQHGGHEK